MHRHLVLLISGRWVPVLVLLTIWPAVASGQGRPPSHPVEIGLDLAASPSGDGGSWWSVAPRASVEVHERTAVEVDFAPELGRDGFSTVDYTLVTVRRAFLQSPSTVVTGSVGASFSRRTLRFVPVEPSFVENALGPTIGFAVEQRLASRLAVRVGADFVMGDHALLRMGGGLTVPVGDRYEPAAASLAETSGGTFPPVRPGQLVWITDAAGVTRRGQLASSGANALTLRTTEGAVTIALGEVRRIEKADTLLNGLSIGVASGAISGGVFGAIIGNLVCDEGGGCPVVGALVFGGIGGGIGALTGLLIDSFRDGRETIYDTAARPSTGLMVTPIVNRRAAGVRAAIDW